MSAGVCIMNKNAIALAADSAVTIGKHRTIFNSANKLFALSNKAPIGAIIYSNAEMQYIPMEIILKQFKLYLGDNVFPELKDYFNSFIKFLLEKENLFHFGNTESTFVNSTYVSLLNGLKNDYESELRRKIEKKGKNLTRKVLINQFNGDISDSGTAKVINRLNFDPARFGDDFQRFAGAGLSGQSLVDKPINHRSVGIGGGLERDCPVFFLSMAADKNRIIGRK